MGNHKKKLIGVTLLALVVYYLKRQMTLENLMATAEKLLSFAEYLPLPDPPVYRAVIPIEKANPQVHPCLKAFINIEDIKTRIKVIQLMM
jgi:hypothetical protein